MAFELSSKTVAENLRRIRREQGWSQEICAEKCGLHRTYIGAVERGERNITLATLDAIAKALKVTPIELLTKNRQ
jgi:transcriptional regulator with XRE-family HTH domain